MGKLKDRQILDIEAQIEDLQELLIDGDGTYLDEYELEELEQILASQTNSELKVIK